MSEFKIIIPARYASSRLPGKPLLEIAGKPLLQHVYESACESTAVEVIIATDDERIVNAAKDFGAKTMMTSTGHVSGTDRLAEVIINRNENDETVIVNVQGDELGMSPEVINQVAAALIDNVKLNMSTVCERINDVNELLDPNIVKVVFNKNNEALYFSRAPIPWDRNSNMNREILSEKIASGGDYYRHIGLYAYRAGFLKRYSKMSSCELEQLECLEQLRVLHHGEKIAVVLAEEKTGIGVDTEKDLEEARKRLV